MCVTACDSVCMYTCFLVLSLRGIGSSDTLVAMSTCSAQILVSKHFSPLKGTRAPWGMADSRIEQRNEKMSLNYLWTQRKKVLKE